MHSVEPEYPSVAALVNASQSGKVSAKSLVQHYLNAINKIESQINCYVTVNEGALAQAEALDALPSAQRGPLFGVPIAVKDQVETADLRTTFGSQACSAYVPSTDATIIRKLKDAGAIVIGKTTMPDWATSWFSTSSASGMTQNPYDLTRDVGGSSSGSAAAVRAGLAAAAIGGDTGGSIRLPSSFCGLVGVRVTPGRISRHGMSALVEPQDTPGPMTLNVSDAARILDVIVGYDEKDPETTFNIIHPLSASSTPFQDAILNPSLKGRRIGVLRDVFGTHLGVNEALKTALENFKSVGAELIDVSITDLDRFRSSTSMYVPRAKSDINKFLGTRPSLSHICLEELHASGGCDKYLDLIDAIVKGPCEPESDPALGKTFLEQLEFRRTVAAIFADYQLDAIVYPTCQLPAPKQQDIINGRWTCLTYPTNTVIASQLLFPAVSVPIGLVNDHEHEQSSGGPRLPAGLEILGLPGGEEKLMAIAAAVEFVQRVSGCW